MLYCSFNIFNNFSTIFLQVIFNSKFETKVKLTKLKKKLLELFS